MKTKAKILVAFIPMTYLLYLAFSLAAGTFNIECWEEVYRCFATFVWLVYIGISFGLLMDMKD